MNDLSILVVSRGEPFAFPLLRRIRSDALYLKAEFVLCADGPQALARLTEAGFGSAHEVRSAGFVESVLDEAISKTTGAWVLRLDDDETMSPAMARWIRSRTYEHEANDGIVKWPCAALWRDAHSFILNPPLHPDHHGRLTIREKAGGRTTPHAGSPFPGGSVAPALHLHWKFLARSFEDRLMGARKYEAHAEGYGLGGMLPFSLPEVAFREVTLAHVGDGAVREYLPGELERVSMPSPPEGWDR